MKTIVYFSDIFYPTFPRLEINLVNRLKRRADVKFCMFDDDPRLTKYAKAYEHLDVIPVASVKQVVRLMTKKSLYVSRFDYGKYPAGQAARQSRRLGARVFMHDVAGIDMAVREGPANYVAIKSEWLRGQMRKNRFMRAYDKSFVTGTIHFDEVAAPVDRAGFNKKYNLDPKKHLLLLTPANPGEVNSQGGIEKDYRRIVQIVSSLPQYQLMIKGHPFDYSHQYKKSKAIICKVTKYGNKSSWEVFARKYNIPVCSPEDGYNAIKCCRAVLNIRSSLALEIPMFYKPLININRQKYVTNWVFDPNTMIDIKLKNLKQTLEGKMRPVSKPKCDAYVTRHCCANDGKAYKRIAWAVGQVL